jgi:hypothetical protein
MKLTQIGLLAKMKISVALHFLKTLPALQIAQLNENADTRTISDSPD